MDKEEALLEFLQGLRVAINNSLGYSRQHPYFLKSSQDFKTKIDNLLQFLNPVKVNVAPESLFLDGKEQKKVALSSELARTLHQRKIKSLEFKTGITIEELADFLSLLSLSPKEIIRKGGIHALLTNAKSQHIGVYELDYSKLLGSEGEEAKDVWQHLFKDTLARKDEQEIIELADNFSKNVNSLSIKKILEDDKLREGIRDFLRYLKEHQKEKFSKCSQELSGLILNKSNEISPGNADKLKEVFSDLDTNDFTNLLISQLSSGSGSNTLNFGLFSRLAGEDKAGSIASGLLTGKTDRRVNPENKKVLLKKIESLLFGDPNSSPVSPAYRAALTALIKDNPSSAEAPFFDREQLRGNYRMVILNLFAQEENAAQLGLILNRINKEWANTAEDRDYRFLRHLLDVLKKKGDKLPLDLSEGIEAQIVRIIEANVWDEAVSEDLGYLVDFLEKSHSTAYFYLDKIFREKRLNVYGLKLFLKLFPAELDKFYACLREQGVDLEFLSRVIKAVNRVHLPVSLAVLKEIFQIGNELIRVEVLDAMRENPQFDPEFIFPMLGEKNAILKKKALEALLRDGIARQKALSILLGISSPLGMRNKLLLENIVIVENLDVRDSKDYLTAFSKRRFFWNWRLRDKALTLLKKWER
jgi:hypothetical protein